MRTLAWAAVFAVLLSSFACGGASPPETPKVVAHVDAASVAASDDAAVEAAAAPEATETVTIAPPAPVACTFSTDAIGNQGIVLRRAPGGEPFARIAAKTKARVSLLASGTGYVEADTGTLRVRGYAADLDVQAKRAVVLGGFMVPSTAYMRLHAASDDNATVALPKVAGVKLVESAATATVACTDLLLGGAKDFDPAAALPAATRSRKAMLADRDVALSIEPKGDVVAQIRLPITSTVRVIAEGGGRARIVVTSDAGLVFGWVASADVRPVHVLTQQEQMMLALGGGVEGGVLSDSLGTGLGIGLPTSPLNVMWPPAIDELSCPSELRLMAEMGGDRFFAGMIAASSTVRVVARDATFVRVALPSQTRGGFAPTAGVSLLVPTRDVASCTSQPVTADPPPPGSQPPPAPKPPPVNGDVQIGTVSATVPIPNLARIIAALRPRLRACYNTGLQRNPTETGRFVLEIRIAPEGSVIGVSVKSNSGIGSDVTRCMANAARNLSFEPSASSATLSVAIMAIIHEPRGGPVGP